MLQGAGAKNILGQKESSILDEISPSKKNHVSVLVSMLNEKNKYIRQLHKKIDKLNDLIYSNASPGRKPLGNKGKLSPSNLNKSRSNQNIQRAKSVQMIGGNPQTHRPKSKPKKNESSYVE
jgi:hypothetical protein